MKTKFGRCSTNLVSKIWQRNGIIEYDGDNTRQIDGLYTDSNYVYVFECKYRERIGKNQPVGSILKDVSQWAGQWKRVCKSLNKIEKYKGKTPIFVLATYGVEWSEKLRNEIQNSDLKEILLDRSSIDQLIGMVSDLGEQTTNALFKQEIFKNSKHHSDIKSTPIALVCTKTEIDGLSIFQFFAEANKLLELSHVPRRMPSGEI